MRGIGLRKGDKHLLVHGFADQVTAPIAKRTIFGNNPNSMMDYAKQFGQMVQQRLKLLNSNVFAVETQSHLPPDAIRNVVRTKKQSGPTLTRAQEICEALGLELYIGPPREPGPVKQLVINRTDFAPAPRLDARLSADPGVLNGDAEVVETLAFRRDWLEKMNIPPSKAVLVSVVGNSMQPGLHDGDLAMVDTSRTVVRSGQVYALSDIDNQTLVKRIDLLPGNGLILRSDNPDFAAMPRLGDDANRIKVHGQVVWSGHVWK